LGNKYKLLLLLGTDNMVWLRLSWLLLGCLLLMSGSSSRPLMVTLRRNSS
jgi:hypothetical protein